MTEADSRSGEDGLSRAQQIADFLVENRITIVPSDGGRDNVDKYIFFLLPNGKGKPKEIGMIAYDRARGHVLPVEFEELLRKLQTHSLVSNALGPFADLLIKTGGDFYADDFKPIRDALDVLRKINPQ